MNPGNGIETYARTRGRANLINQWYFLLMNPGNGIETIAQPARKAQAAAISY